MFIKSFYTRQVALGSQPTGPKILTFLSDRRITARLLLRISPSRQVMISSPPRDSMMTSVAELREARKILEECKSELREQAVPFSEDIKVGVMIETPAAVFVASALAQECDFFSIGTNDLTQYVMAADRGNSKVTSLYNPYADAVVEAVRQTIAAARVAGIECGMCGEFASDSNATRLLLDCGLQEFSVNISSIGEIKSRLQEIISKR